MKIGAELEPGGRDERLLQYMREGLPSRNISAIEGVGIDYVSKLCRKLARKHNVIWNPDKLKDRGKDQIVGISEGSRRMRSKLGDRLYDLGDDFYEIRRATGLNLRQQKAARQRPFNHDWSLSQIERLAKSLKIPFAELMRQVTE